MNSAILLAIILSLIHYFSDIFGRFFKLFHIQTISFSAGFFISFIFLELFPKITEGSIHINVYLLILIGFTLFHLTEKFVYQHSHEKHHLVKELTEVHMVGFFIDHFIVGFILILTLKLPDLTSLIIFIPLALHTISSSLTLEKLHAISKSHFWKVILSLSTVIGAFVAVWIVPFGAWYYGLFGLFLGALFYIVTRDVIPKRSGGDPVMFLIGVLLNFVLVSLVGVIG